MECAILLSHRTDPKGGNSGYDGETGSTTARRLKWARDAPKASDQTVLETGEAMTVTTRRWFGTHPNRSRTCCVKVVGQPTRYRQAWFIFYALSRNAYGDLRSMHFSTDLACSILLIWRRTAPAGG